MLVAPMPKCYFNMAVQHGYSSVNLLYVSKTNLPKTTSEGEVYF